MTRFFEHAPDQFINLSKVQEVEILGDPTILDSTADEFQRAAAARYRPGGILVRFSTEGDGGLDLHLEESVVQALRDELRKA